MGHMTKPDGDIHVRKVDNPYLTDAMRVDGTGVRRIDAAVNMRTLLGGFCRFHGTQSQNQTVARFKALAEKGMLGGARAIDLSREAVDGGGINPDYVQISGIDAREELRRVWRHMGETDYRRLWFVVMENKGPTAYTRWRMKGRKPGSDSIAKHSKELRAIVSRLSDFMGYSGERVSNAKITGWGDGTRAV